MKEPRTTVYVRLDAGTLARIDALASALSLTQGKRKRAMALRTAILMGLEAFAAESHASPPKKR